MHQQFRHITITSFFMAEDSSQCMCYFNLPITNAATMTAFYITASKWTIARHHPFKNFGNFAFFAIVLPNAIAIAYSSVKNQYLAALLNNEKTSYLPRVSSEVKYPSPLNLSLWKPTIKLTDAWVKIPLNNKNNIGISIFNFGSSNPRSLQSICLWHTSILLPTDSTLWKRRVRETDDMSPSGVELMKILNLSSMTGVNVPSLMELRKLKFSRYYTFISDTSLVNCAHLYLNAELFCRCCATLLRIIQCKCLYSECRFQCPYNKSTSCPTCDFAAAITWRCPPSSSPIDNLNTPNLRQFLHDISRQINTLSLSSRKAIKKGCLCKTTFFFSYDV